MERHLKRSRAALLNLRSIPPSAGTPAPYGRQRPVSAERAYPACCSAVPSAFPRPLDRQGFVHYTFAPMTTHPNLDLIR